MKRNFILPLLLAGCAAPHHVPPPQFPDCPHPIAIPASAPKHPTTAQADALEIRVELAREAERARGNACSQAVEARDSWIKSVLR